MEEALRSSRVPGIAFFQGHNERRPAVVFSGLEVWGVVATWKEAGESWEELLKAHPEVSEHQLRAGLACYQAHPEEIEERLEREAYWTPQRVAEEMPLPLAD